MTVTSVSHIRGGQEAHIGPTPSAIPAEAGIQETLGLHSAPHFGTRWDVRASLKSGRDLSWIPAFTIMTVKSPAIPHRPFALSLS